MVALKAHQVNGFLAKPDPKVRAMLLYGPDAGLVSERGQKLAALLAAREKPQGEVLRLDDADLESDPDRLGIELLTVPMFGGAKIVRAAAGRRVNAAVRSLLGAGELAGALIVEAGELRKDEGLLGVFEKNAATIALPCFPDESSTLDGMVAEMLAAARIEIADDARQELVARLGADRVLSRSEIEKLLIHVHGSRRIELHHVEAAVGDAAANAVDLVIAAAAGGEAAAALAASDRAVAAGESGQSIMLAAERHFQRLHKLRVSVDAGRSVDDLMRQLRPPLPPKVKSALERQVRAWTTARVAAALQRISEAIRSSRTTGADETVLAERALMEIARLARMSSAARRPS
ncbi:MAG: DNA polymerase III subunit delta [Hyphomicrobiaceae bacterium]|nr:DNA polymerase III subunit delta [Hyphomicrobiaceae bacterium]